MARLATTRGGSGEPLVLIHGLGSSRTVWDGMRSALEREFDVIAFDLPGFGDQPWFDDGTPATMDSLASAAAAELDELGIERPIVVGNSMGGWIAIELGRRGRARDVIAIGPVGGATPGEARASRRVLRISRAMARAAAPVRSTIFRSRLIRRIGFSGSVTGDVSYRDAVVSVGYMAGSEGYDKLLDEVAGEGDLIEANRARFGEVECPVLILFGNQDRVLAPAGGPRIAEAIPHADLRMLEGYGHAPMLDRPDDVAGMVLERAKNA